MRCNGKMKESGAREQSGNAGEKNLLRFHRNYPLEILFHPVFQIVEADDRRLRAFQQMKLKTHHSLRQSGICGKVGWNGTTPGELLPFLFRLEGEGPVEMF